VEGRSVLDVGFVEADQAEAVVRKRDLAFVNGEAEKRRFLAFPDWMAGPDKQ
jgi:hypothetical protein